METRALTLSQSQQAALASLLEDSGTAELVQQELIQSGTTRLPEYQKLLEKLTGTARNRLTSVIQQIESADALGNISRGLARLKNFSQVEDLCWELTRAEHTGFNAGPYRRTLDRWAAELAPMLNKQSPSADLITTMATYLSGQQRLAGNTLDYYHPRNCFLPWVIEFRCGLPITLTLIYILVGQRLGLQVEGINAPGHFLARLGDTIFDPYHGGKILSQKEWDTICSELPKTQRPSVGEGCSPVNFVHRLLINLRNAHVKRDNVNGRRRIDSYLAVLQR